jgi:hypothetical protein
MGNSELEYKYINVMRSVTVVVDILMQTAAEAFALGGSTWR